MPLSICGRKLRHFPIKKGTESNRKHTLSWFQRTCPAKGKEPSETREVTESDVIPSEQPELKVTVTRLPSIILTNFIKTKAASDALQCPATSPENCILKINQGTSLVAQWLRIRLPMEGTPVRSLAQEDPTCCGATKRFAPQLMSQHSRAREPQLLSPRATTTVACAPRARALQQDKPLQWEACTRQQRVAPARHN